MSDGYVYLIVEGDQYGEEKYKIGITKNSPQERLRKLKTGNSNELDVLKVYRSRNYKKILSENEFFYLTNEQVLGFIDSCKEAENIVDALRDNPFYK